MSKERMSVHQDKVGIIGLGKTGQMYQSMLQQSSSLDVVGMHHSQMREMLIKERPHYLILATPNPIDESMEMIREQGQSGLGVVLLQNGVKATEVAMTHLASRADIDIYRGVLMTVVGQDVQGNPSFNREKLAVGLSAVRGQRIKDIAGIMEISGFEIKTYANPIAMEWTKLFFNMINLRAIRDGRVPSEAFMDEELFASEFAAILQRRRILQAAHIPLVNLPGAPGYLLEKVLDFPLTPKMVGLFKKQIATAFARARGDALPSAYEAIRNGKAVETRYYLEPWIDLANQCGLPPPIYETSLLAFVEEYEQSREHTSS